MAKKIKLYRMINYSLSIKNQTESSLLSFKLSILVTYFLRLSFL